MAGGAPPNREVVLETDRLLLRPWRVAEAVVQRELWTERDPRVPSAPPHRRGLTPHGRRPRGVDSHQPAIVDRVARVERKAARDGIGYCGLIEADEGRKGNRNWRSSCYAGCGVRDTRPRPRWRFWTGRDRPGTNVCGPRSGSGTPLLAGCWPRLGSPRPGGRRWTLSTGPPCSPRDSSDTRRSAWTAPPSCDGRRQASSRRCQSEQPVHQCVQHLVGRPLPFRLAASTPYESGVTVNEYVRSGSTP